MACLGWIGLAIAIARRNWYVSQHGFLNEIPGEGVIDVLEYWFVAGVLLVTLDTLRRKSDAEEEFWRIAAISFGLTAVGLGVNFAIGGYAKIMLGVGGSEFNEAIASILGTPASLLLWFFGVTSIFGAPAYTLFLTHRAISSWLAYIRPA